MSDRLRFAVVGTRFWSEGFHLPGLSARGDVTIAALCGRDRAHAQAVAARFDWPALYTDWREMLARERLDGIAIVTPNALHHPIALAAFDAGLHVICDKPLALDAQQAREMLERARAKKRQHLTMFTYRAMPAARRVKELIDAGYLGRPYHVTGVYYHTSLLDPSRPVAWRMQRAEAGAGTLADLGVHLVDLTRWWVGDFARVSGHLATYTRVRPDPRTGTPTPVDADDAAVFVAELAGSPGAQGFFHVSKVTGGRGNYIRLELYGSEGALILEADPGNRENWIGTLLGARRGDHDFNDLEVPARLAAGFDKPDTALSLAAAYRVITDPFFAAIRANSASAPEVPSSFVDGLAAQEVIDAVVRSAASGRWETP